MAKRIRFKNNAYLDSSSIVHGNKMLSNVINKLMQDNSGIVVSATEPVKDRKRVWMQKGKNYFNKNNLKIINAWQVSYTIDNNKKIEINVTATGGVAFVRTNNTELKADTYTFSATIQGQLNEIRVYTADSSSLITSKSNTFTFTLTKDTSIYFDFYVYNTSLTNSLTVENIQIEQGSVATDYEAYIEPKIYVLNNNNVYEELIMNNLTQDTGWVKLTLTNGTNAAGWKPVVARRKGNVVQITGAVKGLEREWQPILTLPEEFRPNFYRTENEGASTFQYITPCINNPKHTQCLNLSAGGVLNVTTVFGRTLSINDEIQLDITYLV